MNDEAELLCALNQHTGTNRYFRHPFNRSCTYTEGVKAFAEQAGNGAYWLLDILMTEPAILRTMRADGFLIIELIVVGHGATLTAKTDTHEPPIYRRAIDTTDCPQGTWSFYFSRDVLMLPSEY